MEQLKPNITKKYDIKKHKMARNTKNDTIGYETHKKA